MDSLGASSKPPLTTRALSGHRLCMHPRAPSHLSTPSWVFLLAHTRLSLAQTSFLCCARLSASGDEFTRVTDLTAGQHLSYSNACQLLFPWVPTPEGLGFDPSLDSLLDLLAEMGLLATKPEDGSARSRRLSERAPLLVGRCA